MTSHPNRNWRRRMRDAADAAAVKLARKRTDNQPDYMLAALIAREAYIEGYIAGRERKR